MQRSKDSDLLPGSWATKLRLSIFLLPALIVSPAFGQEPILTLAMVAYDQAPVQLAAVTQANPVVDAQSYASVPRLGYQTAGLNINYQNTADFSAGFVFEKNNGSNLCDRFQSIDKKLKVDGQAISRVHLEAGYGPFCQYTACFGSNAVELELQQPNCAYLRASFSF